MRSFSSSRIAGSVYMDEGRVCARATSGSSFISEGHSRTPPQPPPHSVGRVRVGMVRKASLAIVNGVIWGSTHRATALGVEGDRIAAIGTDEDVRSLIDGATRVLDARGGTILPAFNDSHVHFLIAS